MKWMKQTDDLAGQEGRATEGCNRRGRGVVWL